MTFRSSFGGRRLQQVAAPLLFLTCFVVVSRVTDVAGKGLKLPAILLGLLGVVLVASGRGLAFWRTTAGKVMPIFAAWALLTFFLSQRGPAGAFYMQTLLEGMLFFAAAAGLLTTASDFNKLFIALAGGGLAAAVLGIVWSGQHEGRFALRDGPYADANYYAMWLLALTPLVWTVIAGNPFWTRLAAGIASAFMLFVMARSESRASMVALLAMLVVIFILSSLTTRLLIGTLAAVGGVILVAFVPATLTRLMPATERGADSDSTTARKTLLATGLAVTLNNPLFGVGPGNFPFYVVEEGRAQGMDWAPLNTHNAYTQVASETGVPGAILYLLLIGFSIRNIVSLLRQSAPGGETPDVEVRRLARGLLLSLAAILTSMFFLSEGYNAMVLLWLGLAGGLRQLLPEPEVVESEEQEAPA